MDVKVVADALFDGSVIALVAAATSICLDLFGFLNLMSAGAFILGAAEESAFAVSGAPQWERVAAGAAAAAIAGFLFDRFALYPLRKRGANDLMAASGLAAFLIVLGYLAVFRLDAPGSLARSPLSERIADVAGFTFTELQALAVVLCILGCVGLHIAVYRTRFGLGVRAAIENSDAAQFMGVRADRVPPSAMAAICAAAGVGGAIFAMHAGAPALHAGAPALQIGAPALQIGQPAIAMPVIVLLSALAACILAPTGSVSAAVVLSFALALAVDTLAAHRPAFSSHVIAALMLAAVAIGVAIRSTSPAVTVKEQSS